MQSFFSLHRFAPKHCGVAMLFSLLFLLLSGVAYAKPNGKPLVVASIQPLSLFAEEFFGNQVTVRTLLLPSPIYQSQTSVL